VVWETVTQRLASIRESVTRILRELEQEQGNR
jgi:hypothetical protein